MKIEILKAKNKEPYFVVKARNGRVILTSETYKRRRSLDKAVSLVKTMNAKTPIVDLS